MPGAAAWARCTRWVSAIEEATTRPVPKAWCAQATISAALASASRAFACCATARRSVSANVEVIAASPSPSSGGQAACVQEPSLDRREHRGVDGDAAQEDQRERGEGLPGVGVVPALLQQLAEPGS